MLAAVRTPEKMSRPFPQASAGNRSNPPKQSMWGQGSKEREVWEESKGGGNDDGSMGSRWGKELEMVLW